MSFPQKACPELAVALSVRKPALSIVEGSKGKPNGRESTLFFAKGGDVNEVNNDICRSFWVIFVVV